jgi:PEP-CTERM motif
MFAQMAFRRALLFVSIGFGGMFAAPQTASADVIFTINSVITGSAPVGPTPWMTAQFSNAGANTVTMTLSNLLPVGPQFVTDFFFNVDPAIAAMTVSNTGGQAPDTIFPYSQGAYGNPAFGNDYDVRLDFENANNPNRFTGGETSVYTLTGVGLTENSFTFTTPSNAGPQYMSAHVQGIPQGVGSGRIGPNPNDPFGGGFGDPVPEPTTLIVFGALGGLGLLSRRLRKTS